MNRNPEFIRNLWLEITAFRLAGMPVVIGAILLLAAALNYEDPIEPLATTSLFLFGGITVLWGTRLASEAIVNEVRDRTWDTQRMSSIGPWAMTWGKLLGSTVYQWYGGLICLLAFALTYTEKDYSAFNIVVIFALSALLGHAVSLLVSVQVIRKERKFERSHAAAFFVLGIGVALPMLKEAFSKGTTEWYGITVMDANFAIVSILVFLAWVVLGIYRLMRTELQIKNGPFAWPAFVCFISFYIAGFINAGMFGGDFNYMSYRFSLAFAVAVGLTYIMALTERKDPVAIRRLLMAFRYKDWKRVLYEVPCWLATLFVVVAAGIGMVFMYRSGDIDYATTTMDYYIFVAACILFLLRDISLLLLLNFTRDQKRADMLFVLVLFLLYGVVPGIMSGLGVGSVVALFWPTWKGYAILSLGAGVLELALVAFLAVKRWRILYSTF